MRNSDIIQTIVDPPSDDIRRDWRKLDDSHWFRVKCAAVAQAYRFVQPSAYEGLVASSTEQMYAARSAFKDDANQSVAALLASMAASGVLLFHGLEEQGETRLLLVFLSMVAFPGLSYLVLDLYRDKLSAGYDLYISACIHSTMLHCAFGIPYTHQWHHYVIEYLQRKGTYEPRVKRMTARERECMSPAYQVFVPDVNGKPPQNIEQVMEVWRKTSGNIYVAHLNTLITGVALSVLAATVTFGYLIYLVLQFLEKPR